MSMWGGPGKGRGFGCTTLRRGEAWGQGLPAREVEGRGWDSEGSSPADYWTMALGQGHSF